jgi:hypothetical protein
VDIAHTKSTFQTGSNVKHLADLGSGSVNYPPDSND